MFIFTYNVVRRNHKHMKDFCVSISINIVYIAKIKRSSRYSEYYNSEAGLRVKQPFGENTYFLVL